MSWRGHGWMCSVSRRPRWLVIRKEGGCWILNKGHGPLGFFQVLWKQGIEERILHRAWLTRTLASLAVLFLHSPHTEVMPALKLEVTKVSMTCDLEELLPQTGLREANLNCDEPHRGLELASSTISLHVYSVLLYISCVCSCDYQSLILRACVPKFNFHVICWEVSINHS